MNKIKLFEDAVFFIVAHGTSKMQCMEDIYTLRYKMGFLYTSDNYITRLYDKTLERIKESASESTTRNAH